MEQKFKRIAKNLYERTYQTASGDQSVLFYARFKCRLKNKPRVFSLGSDLAAAKDKLKMLEAQDVDRYDFDLDRQRARKIDSEQKNGKHILWTFAEWAERYPEEYASGKKNRHLKNKDKRSFPDERRMIDLHLKPFFQDFLLTEISRESLTRYSELRRKETTIRCGKWSSKVIASGTVANELSLLRHMLGVALREGYKVSIPSFDGLIVRAERSGRALSDQEQVKALAVYPKWMARFSEFAKETGLSEGDILRLDDTMIDCETGVIIPEGGRIKTEVDQVAPLTDRAREIIEGIKADMRSGAIVENVGGLIFTREDGKPITRSMINYWVKKAVRKGKVKKFKFHDYRNTALTEWHRGGISVDAAMRAGGWKSVQMYKRYLDLNKEDIAREFGTSRKLENATRIATQKAGGYSK